MMDAFDLPEEDDEEIDIYDALGLNTPVASQDAGVQHSIVEDPLAAFMDDDEEDELPGMTFVAQDELPGMTFVEETPSATISAETVETLLATLARDLLDDERLQASLGGGFADLNSLKVERDRDAYHLSLIVDMGGQNIRPFATVIAVENAWKPLHAPKGLHARWKPLYDSLCAALAGALNKHGQPSSL